jgi:hypothetical protein
MLEVHNLHLQDYFTLENSLTATLEHRPPQ